MKGEIKKDNRLDIRPLKSNNVICHQVSLFHQDDHLMSQISDLRNNKVLNEQSDIYVLVILVEDFKITWTQTSYGILVIPSNMLPWLIIRVMYQQRCFVKGNTKRLQYKCSVDARMKRIYKSNRKKNYTAPRKFLRNNMEKTRENLYSGEEYLKI